jgi:hypothetical protein
VLPFNANLSRIAWTFLITSKQFTLQQAMKAQRASGGIKKVKVKVKVPRNRPEGPEEG